MKRALKVVSGLALFAASSLVIAHWFAVLPIQNPQPVVGPTQSQPVSTQTQWFCVRSGGQTDDGPWTSSAAGEAPCGARVAADGTTRYLEERVTQTSSTTQITSTRRFEVVGSTQIRVPDAQAQLLIVNGSNGSGDADNCADSSYVDYAGQTYPDESCTGWEPTGATLSSWDGSCTLGSGTYDSYEFDCNPLNLNANNITITRSQINGVVRTNSSSRTGLLLEDITIDGLNSGSGGAGGQQCFGGNTGSSGGADADDYVVRRAHMVGCEIAIYGRGITVEASYVHDNSCTNQSYEVHREVFLIQTGEVYLVGNNFVGNLRSHSNPCSGSDGTSAVGVIYTHGGFWPAADDVLIQGNRFEQPGPGTEGYALYCVYSGEYPESDQPNSNVRWKDNVFARSPSNVCGGSGPVYSNTAPTGTGSCWSGNRYENDGTIISPSGASTCP